MLTTSNVKYCDYIALLCAFDAEWSQPLPNDCGTEDPLTPFRNVFQHFTTECWQYREQMTDILSKMGGVITAGGQEYDREPDRRLFNPVCYVPFGHADALCLVLLDDCDTAFQLADSAITTTESVSLGFCPSLKSLGVKDDDALFCELDKLMGAAPRPTKCSAGSFLPNFPRHQFSPVKHVFEAASPLMVFSKFKVDGLAAVGPGLLLQQALFRAMIQKTRETVNLLGEPQEQMGAASKAAVDALLSKADLDATKVVILDLLGAQEVGMLVFSPNFSIAASILAGLRSLTFDDLLKPETDVDGSLRVALEHSEAHGRIIQFGGKEKDTPKHPSEIVRSLDSSHVFRWTHSTAAMSWSEFSANEPQRFRGLVEAATELQIAPGHTVSAERRLHRRLVEEGGTTGVPEDTWRYHRYLTGTADMPFMYGHCQQAEPAEHALLPGCPLVPLSDVVRSICTCLAEFSAAGNQGTSGRDITDFSTSLAIPVPEVLDAKGNNRLFGRSDNHFSPLRSALTRVREKIFRDPGFPRRTQIDERDFFNVHTLRDKQKACGIPKSLRRTNACLFHGYALLLTDPFMFDQVLDLYDAFAALYGFIASGVSAATCASFVVDDTFTLSEVIDALRDSLDHRTFLSYREPPVRERTSGFRGGMNQMLFAADVPIKCGLGLLRRFVREQSAKPAARNSICVPTKIEFQPGARIKCQPFTVNEKRIMLGHLGSDIPHLLNVARYGDHLHETFHVILEELHDEKKEDNSWPDFGVSPDDPEGKEGYRLKEVFVMFLSQLFLCGSDVRTFRRQSAITFSEGLAGVGEERTDTIIRLTEWLSRLFLATDVLAERTDIPEHVRNDPARWGSDEWTARRKDTAPRRLDRFKAMCDDLKPFLHDYRRVFEGRDSEKAALYLHKEFDDIYKRAAPPLRPLWTEAMKIYRRFIIGAFPGTALLDGNDRSDQAIAEALAALTGERLIRYEGTFQRLLADAKNALRDGAAVLRRPCPENCRTGEDQSLDPMLLVCAMLRAYYDSYDPASAEDHAERPLPEGERCIDRDSTDNQIKPDGSKRYHEFLIDRGAATMFSVVPNARRRRLKEHIAIVKTFWGISSTLRARRVVEILSHVDNDN